MADRNSTLLSNGLSADPFCQTPVYEFHVDNTHIMRRRQDDWINATHILKVADYDKPARTRILEREVQKGIHEKVQGGYGKYQGTWVPLHEGRLLAERNNVLGKLLPIFDYKPGAVSPPQAPKHQTAASTKGPRVSKASQVKRNNMPPPKQMMEDPYDGISAQLNDDESMDRSEIGSESFMAEEEMLYGQQSGPRKRNKRGPDPTLHDQQHTLYADNLLDYFLLSTNDRHYSMHPPQPPEGFVVNRPIDDQGHTALHWGAAMGDLTTMRMFINRGARIDVPNVRGETPLIRAVLFTNNFEKQSLPEVVDILRDTIMQQDRFGATVLHHIAMTTKSSSRKKSARYYFTILLTKLRSLLGQQDFMRFLERCDDNGDTAVHLLARENARRCVRIFLAHDVNVHIPNNKNETASEILHRSHHYRNGDFGMASSSPVQPSSTAGPVNGLDGAGYASQGNSLTTNHHNNSQYETQSARSFSTSFGPTVNDKALHLTLTMEDEIRQVEESLTEVTRLIDQTTNERKLINQKLIQASLEENANNNDHYEMEMRQLSETNAFLVAANESLLEQDQHGLLHSEVAHQESNIPSEIQTRITNGIITSEDEIATKLETAHALANAQARRRELCKELVLAQAEAGMTEKGELYKRLIAESLNRSPEAVVELVPELLEEFE
ncbi:MAG: hypothetical protein Q9174_004303, partial [Haloplaca sp. 1 TL-2023]